MENPSKTVPTLAMIAGLNGVMVTRVKDTIFIPLPKELWRPCECSCEYCSDDPKKNQDGSGWDTLAVAKNKPTKGYDYSWTVHYPQLHGELRPKRKAGV